MTNKLRGLIMGCPGSGKGTQTARILKKFPHELKPSLIFSSGDCLRDQIQRNTAIGKQVESLIARGELVPDSIITPMMLEKVEDLLDTNWILDGFPRTVEQARKLDSLLDRHNTQINFVIDLDVPHSVILQRIEDRWIHAPSGRVYNLSFNPPSTAGKDDVTGEPLTKRPDDNASVFKKRLEKYEQATHPLIQYYKSRKVLHQFQGATSDEITPRLITALASHFHKSKI